MDNFDDGLNDEERELLQTPVSRIAPEQRHILVNLRDKKAEHIYAQNDLHREKTRKPLFEDQNG